MKKLLALILISLFIFCISAVNAEDISLDNVNLDDNSSLINNTSSHNHTQASDILSNTPVKAATLTAPGGTFTQLQTIINSSSSGDTIVLTGDYYYDTGFTVTGIVINKDLTFIGNNHTLDGMDNGTIFVTAGGVSLTIQDIIFTHGRSNNYWNSELRGGAIWANGPLYAYNCTFINNTAVYWGAGIEFWGGVAYIDGCYFINNHGTSDLTINGGQVGYITRSYFKSNETTYPLYLNSGSISRSTILRANQYLVAGNPNTVNIGMNWWGSNLPDFSLQGFIPESWIVMNFTNTSSFSNSNVNLLTSMDWIFNTTTNTYQPLTNDTLAYHVNYTVNTGSISSLSADFLDNYTNVYSYTPGTNTVLTATVDYQTLKITQSPHIGSYTELQALIDNTPSGGTLVLDKDYEFDLAYDLPYRNGMIINKSITIKGNNHYISGMNITFMFKAYSTDFRVENIIFKDGRAKNGILDGNYRGGAIYAYYSNLYVLNCTFQDNYAINYAGAIESYYGTINILNSTFINNSASSEYGVILAEGTNYGNITGNIFINNTGAGYAVFYLTYGNVTDNVFVNNTGTYVGGYLASGNSNNNWWGSNTPNTYTIASSIPETWIVMNFTNSTPITIAGGTTTLITSLNTIYNRTSLTYSPYTGILPNRTVEYNISTGSLSPLTSNFNNYTTSTYNFPVNNGLIVLYATIDNQRLIISTGSYTYLQGLIDATPDGGVLNLNSEIEYNNITDEWLQSGMIINKSITINGNGHNISGKNQARIFNINNGNVTLTNINMSNGYWNYPTYGNGGGAIILSGFNTNLTLNICTFENNWVSIWGGAIFATSFDTLIINNSIFKNNTQNSGYQGSNYGHGGAIMLTYANDAAQFVGKTFIVNNTIFNNNSITPSTGVQYAASIFTGYITNISITNSVFVDEICNGTTIYGGILSLWGGGVYRTVTNNVFYTTNKGPYGSAIYSGIAGDFNNNWWGTNTPNFSTLLYGGTVPETWFIMNLSSINSINYYSSGSIQINTSLDTIYNSTSGNFSKIINGLPERTVYYNISTGSLATYSSNITNNHINTFNYPSGLSNVYLNATIDNQTLTLSIPDLSLNLNVSTLNPQIGSKFIVKINITNNGLENITFTQGYEAVVVNFTIPYPFLFISSSDGNYSNDTGLWFVGNLSANESKILNITLRTPANQALIGTIVPVNTSATGHFLTYNPNTFYDNKTLTIQNKTTGSYTDLQELIDSTPTNGTLNIPWDVIYDNETDLWLKEGMKLNRSMIVNGSGHYINGLDQARIFWITGLNVTLNDLNMTHGWWGTTTTYNGGGALYIYGSQVNVTINRCNFTDNYVAGWGGAIYSQIFNSLIVNGSYFENNTDTIGSSSAGGAIMLHNGGNLCGNLFVVENSTFIDNNIQSPTNNGQLGGAIYAVYISVINITGNTFYNNSCKDTSASYGGALYLGATTGAYVNYNSFINDYSIYGSEIYIYSGPYDLNYNWWGTNTPNWARIVNVPVETWIIMNFTSPDNLNIGSGTIDLAATLNTAYNKTSNNYTNLTKTIPNRTVTFTTNTGTLTTTTSNITNYVNTTLSYSSSSNLEINATIDNQTLTLKPVDIEIKIVNITKTNPQYGSRIQFTINVTNNGPANITYEPGLDALVLNISLPYPLIYISSTDTNYSNNTGLWFVGNLTVNQTKSINITFRVPPNSSLIGVTIPINTTIAWKHFLTIGEKYDNVTLTIQNKTTGSYTDLQELIDSTPTNGILNVPWDVEYNPLEDLWLKEGMKLNRSMIVNGSGHYISGLDQARIFWITGLNVTLNDLNMTHGWWGTTISYNGGGALYIYGSQVNVTINNCNFTDNLAAGWGGAIYSQIFDTLIINNSYFENNTETTGSASAGGAIMLHNGNGLCGNLFILVNSTFVNNNIQAPTNNGQYGAAVYAWYVTNITILENTFYNNSCKDTSASYAASLFIGSGVGSTVNNNVFVDNHALYLSEIYMYAGPANLNNNWWGTNTPNWPSLTNVAPETWIIMNFTSNNYQLNPTGGNQVFIVTLDTIYNSTSGNYSSLNGTIPNRTVVFDTNVGTLSTTRSNITDKVNTTLSYSSLSNNFLINATIDNQTLSLRLVNVTLNITNITKSSPQIGDRVTFIVNITNHGDYNITYSPGLDGIVVSLPLPSPLIHISSNYDGYWDRNNGLWFVGNLSVNESKIINITFRVPFNKSLIGNYINLNASVLWGHFVSTEKLEDNITMELQDKTTGSYTDLQDFIDSTPVGDVLNLTFNVTYDSIQDVWLQAGMRLNKSISIIGNGFTISGLDLARIFLVTADNINLSNITFTHGYAFDARGDSYRGGAIFSTGDWLNITNCTFIENYAIKYAGAIDQWVGRLIVDDCTFINNTAENYGAIVVDGHSNTEGYITNSLFLNNTGITYSTIHLYQGNLSNNAFVNENGAAYLYTFTPNINNNWWGNNTPDLARYTGYLPETWVIMNFTNITPISYSTGTSTLLVSLDTVYNRTSGNYSNLIGSIPNRTVVFNWTTGTVSPSIINFQNNTTSTFTYPGNMGFWRVNATIDNQTLWLGSTDLGIYITSDKNPVNDGDNITINVTIVNNGIMSAYDVNISIFFPYGFILNNYTNNSGIYNNTTCIWHFDVIHPGENFTISFNGTLANPGEYLIINATIENNTSIYEENFTNNTYSLNVTVIQWCDLEVVKNISNPNPQTKGNVTYIITVFNHGPSTAINVTVFDNLSSNLIFLNYSSTRGVYNESTGVWFIDNITPGGNETLNITVLVNKSGFTNNFVNVSCIHNDTNWTNNIANISFETPPLSDLWVTITMEPQTSNYITYHIQAGNNGIEPANGTVVVFNHSSYYFYYNHTEDKGLYNNLTGVWDIGYLDVNETVNLTLIVRLDFPVGVYFNNVTTIVNITSWSTDLYPENNTDNITFEAELFGNFRLLQDYIDSWAENTTQILPRSFAYDEVQDAKLPTESYDLINGVRLYKNITIINPYGFTIGGYNMARIFNISANNIVLDGLKLADGNSPLGAALNIHADNVQVLRSNFTGNWLFGDYGGAIFTNGANTLIMDSIFWNNSASKLGGAIGALGATNLKILNNTFINNTVESDSVFGGAIGIENSTGVIINGNVFLDNKAINAPNLGSAIYAYNSDVDLEANWFGNNTPDMSNEHLIWGVKPETYIILDWEIINPNMTGVQLNVVFFLYNRTSGNKTSLGYGIPYRNLSMSAHDPTLSSYNSTYTGNNSAYYTYNIAIPVYEVNATVDYQTITLEWSTFLDAYKSLVNDTIWFGDDLIYLINLTNYGPHNSYIVDIADLLPENLIINSVTATSGSTSIIGDNAYWSIVISAGTNETLIVNTTPTREGLYINNLTVNSTNQYDYFLHGNTSVTGEVLPLFDLSINFTLSNPPYYVGEEINYTITIHNNGPSNATNVNVYIPIPSGLTYLYAWNLGGYIPNYNIGTGLWDVRTLHVNETIQINMTLRLDNPGWYNQTVNITGYGVELNQSNNNQTISFNVTTQVDLELNMTINKNETLYGDTYIVVTYTLLNKGPSPATNVNVYTLFNGLTYGWASGYGSFTNITPFSGYWTVGTLNKDSIVSVSLVFYAYNLGNFTVTGRANSSDNESYWPDNYANVTISVIKYNDLSITKTVNNTTPFLMDTITYTITVTNNQGFNTTDIIVYDPLPSVLLYDNNNPDFNGTHWIVGNLSVGETKTLTFNVTVDGIGIIWNNATVNSSINDSNPGNNHAEVSIDVPVADDLRIYLNVIPSTPSSNSDFLINISVWNRGFTDNQNVTVEFHIPAGLIYINSTQMGAYNLTSGLWDIGFLANGAWTYLEIWVRPDTIGNITITANVSGFVADVAPWNNHANLTFEIVPSFDLTITKTSNTTSINDGDLIGFDISVWNNGPYTATNVKVIDYLPVGLLYYSNNASGVYDNITRTVNWTISSLNVGDNLTFHLTLRSWNPGTSFTNTVTANAYGTDSNITDNTASVSVNVTQINDLEVRINASKTTDIDLGETIVFYITVLNHGPSNATNVIANFQIPNIFTYINDNSMGYYIPSTGDWYIGNLGSGTNTTLAVTVNLTTMGLTKANTTVNSTYLDRNLSNNYDELNLTATPVFDLNITGYWNLTNNTLVWGELANLTIVVHNKGPENATNVTVNIIVPGVSYINDTGLGSFNNNTMLWNIGNLSVGQTKTLTITFKGEDCGFYWTTGNITAHGHDNDTSDNNYTLNLTIIPVVDLVMTNLTVNASFAGVDEILEFNVTVFNKGPCNATNVTIVGLLPTGWTIYSGSIIADIPVNTSHTFNIYVNASTYGNFTVGFNATINGVDTYPLDNYKYIGPIEIIYHADIMISIKVNNNRPATGDIVVYVITVSNLDWRTAHNVTANITIPTNLTLDHYYLSSGSYNPLNGSWSIGDMSFRNSTSLFLFARVNTPGRTSFWVNVTGDDYDFHPENNNDTIDITASPGLDLNITITTDNNTPYTGDNVTFTVVVENIGSVDASDVNVDINIPSGFINPHSSDLNFTGASWFVGNLSSGTSKTLNFTVTPVSNSNLTVNVSVSANKYDYNSSNNGANISVSPQGASDLQVIITSNNSNPLVGENVTYTITVKNNGLIDANNVFIFNNLPYSLTYSTSTLSYNPTTKIWSIGNLPAGKNETLNITINHTTTGIFNYTVNITGNTIDTNTSNNIDNITTNVIQDNDLRVEFTVSNTSILDETLLGFNITVINDGIFNDTNVKVYTDLPTTGIYNSTGLFDTNLGLWDIGNLSAGENKTLTLLINMSGVGNYTFWANVTGTQNDRNLTNNNQNITISVYADFDLTVNITALNTTVNINDTLTFQITVTNNGPSTAYNIQVLDNILGTVEGISKGIYLGNTWNIVSLKSGESETLNLTIKPSTNGTYTYYVNISSDNIIYDNNLSNNHDNITINVTNLVDLIINITTNTTLVESGELVEYTITIFNNGSILATNVLMETLNLFDNVVSINPSTGLVSTNSWLIFTLAPNTSETLKITRYIYNDTVSFVNVTSDNLDSNNSTNYANTTVNTIKKTDLMINISANTTRLYVGDNVTFTITVTNIGNNTADNITVKLDLPYSVNYTSVYMYDSLQGVWLIGDLENNTSISFNVTTILNTEGVVTFNASVNTTTPDIYLLNNRDNVTLNVSSLVDLSISLSLNTTGVLYSGDNFTIFVNVSNYGPSLATNVNVTVNIPGTYTTFNGTYSAGIWNIGNLNIGETVTLNITCNLTSLNNGIYIVNVTSQETDKNTSNNNASINLTIIDISDLGINITSSVNQTDLLNTVIYTITVTNYGPNNVDDAIVELNIPSGFNITSNMSSSGVFNGTHWVLSSLGTGFSGIANLYIFGYYTSYGNQTISVSVNSSNKDFNNTNNLSDVSVWVTPVTNLTVNFTTTGYYNIDGTITFNITVTNNGPCNATDIKIYTNLIPTDSYNETIGYFDTLQDIWYINELQVGETETLIINTTYISGAEVYANVTSSTKELDNSDNFKTLNFTLTQLVDLSINITSNNSNPIYGESVEFFITVTNLGVYNASNVVVYTDLPSTLTYTVSKGLFSTVSGNWSIGNLSVGETVTLKLSLIITNDLISNVNVTGSVNDTNLSNNNDAINISLKHVADLSINLTVNQSSFTVWDNITFTINVTNYGPNSAENLTINITLPEGFIPDTNYNWTISNLANDSSVTYNISGILSTPGIKYVNATVTSDTYDNDTNNNLDLLVFNVEDTVDLIITISSNTSSILAGEYVNLIVNVTNLGNGTAHNVLVQTNILNGTGDKIGYYDKDTGYWYIGNLTNNTSALLNLTVLLNENTSYLVSVNSSNTDTNSSNNNDTLDVTVIPCVDLDISVSVNSKTLYIDDEVIYTIFVSNYGPSLAENVTVNLIGNTLNFTYSNSSNFDNIAGIWSIGNLSSGETVILVLKYLANTTGNITSFFNLTTNTIETNLTNNLVNVTVEVLNSTKPLTNLVDLIINITVDNPNPGINSTVTFNITVYNNASTTATNLTIRSFVPSGLIPLGVFDWNITNLGAYSNVSFIFQANMSSYGSFVVNTSVDCIEWDNNPTSNRANVLIVCNAPSGDYTDLTVNITRKGNLTLDGLVTYVVNVTNFGPSLANDVNVTIGFTDGLEYISDNGSSSYNYTDSLWTIGNMNPGETRLLEIVLNITKQGYYTNVFLVYSGSMDSKPENNLVLDKFEVNDTRVDINIRISANKTYASENETIKFTVTVINPSLNTVHDVNVTLNIPSEFIILNISGNDTNSSYYIGNLTSGASYNFTFIAKLNSTNSSTIIVNATLNDTDSYTGDNIDSITINPLNGNINGVADLMVNITVNEQYPEILTVPIFNVWVTNKGPDDATNITIPVYVPERCVSTSVLTPTGSSWDNSTSTFHISNLSVGATMMLEVSFRINNTEPLLFNVTASCDQFDPNITDNTASISLYPWEATPTCDLNVTIVPVGSEFYANGTVTLNITIRNFGNKTAYNISVRNIVPDGLTIESIKTTWAYTNTSYGWFMSNHPINTNKSFLVTYKIANPGLYHTTVNVNSSTFDVDPTNNGMGVAIYAGEPEPDRRNVTTKTTPTVAVATLSLSADTTWNFKGTLKMANTTVSPTQAFAGQKLYANITKGTFSLTVESIDLTSSAGVANFQVAASQLDGTGNYKVVIYYAGEKTDDTYYLPSVATQQTKRVTINP